MRRAFLFILHAAAVAFGPSQAGAQCPEKPLEGAAAAAEFVTDDIALFWRAVDQAGGGNLAEALDRQYLEKGSAGLKAFKRLRIGDARLLAASVRHSPKYHEALRASSARVGEFVPRMRGAFACLKTLYPEAAFPPVYFVVGRMNSAGTLDGNGLYIGVDMFGKQGDESLAELSSWHKAVVAPVDRLPYIVAHEIIHAQQRYAADNSLLAAALREGVPDFLGKLIAGEHINPHLHQFGDPRERELWQSFEKDMHGSDTAGWLYQGDKARKDRPADLGYYVGYKIAESYYRKAADKKAAIRDMLRIRDFRAFLSASGYAGGARP